MADQKSLNSLKKEERITKCPECGSKELDRKGDERYCKKCGLVIE